MWKLKTQPSVAESVPPATFTDATATGLIQATQEQITAYQERAKSEIAAALKKVPGGCDSVFVHRQVRLP
jgi:hypothetical protein